jgi:hypothetical protein
MEPRFRASLLWGVVSLLAFLVLLQGYELLADERVTLGVKALVAVIVGVTGAGSSSLAYGWVLARRRRNAQVEDENETS